MTNKSFTAALAAFILFWASAFTGAVAEEVLQYKLVQKRDHNTLPSFKNKKILILNFPNEAAFNELLQRIFKAQGYNIVADGEDWDVKITISGNYEINGYKVPLGAIFNPSGNSADPTTGNAAVVHLDTKSAVLSGMSDSIGTGDPAHLLVAGLVSLFAKGAEALVNNTADNTIKPCATCEKQYRAYINLSAVANDKNSRSFKIRRFMVDANDLGPALLSLLEHSFDAVWGGTDGPTIRFPRPQVMQQTLPQDAPEAPAPAEQQPDASEEDEVIMNSPPATSTSL